MLRRKFIAACGAAMVATTTQAKKLDHESGDIIFRRAHFDEITFLIDRFSPAQTPVWTHVGVVVPDQLSNANLVVHANIERGVVFEPIHEFMSQHVGVRFSTLRHPDPNIGQAVSIFATGLIGRSFDSKMLMNDEGEKIYCTELVELALQYSGLVLNTNRITVPFYSEPIIHPDSLFLSLAEAGFLII